MENIPKILEVKISMLALYNSHTGTEEIYGPTEKQGNPDSKPLYIHFFICSPIASQSQLLGTKSVLKTTYLCMSHQTKLILPGIKPASSTSQVGEITKSSPIASCGSASLAWSYKELVYINAGNTTSAQHSFTNLQIILQNQAAIHQHYTVRYDPTYTCFRVPEGQSDNL